MSWQAGPPLESKRPETLFLVSRCRVLDLCSVPAGSSPPGVAEGFLKNKVVQLAAALLQQDYPEE